MMPVSQLIEVMYDARALLQQIGDYKFPDGRGGVRTLSILSLDDCVTNTAQDVVRAFRVGFSLDDQAAALQRVEEDITRITDRVYSVAEVRNRIRSRADQEAPATLALVEVLASPYHVNVLVLRQKAMLAKEALELYSNSGNPLSEQQRYETRRVLRSLDVALKNARQSWRQRVFGEQSYVGPLSVAAVISHVKRAPPKKAETNDEKRTAIDGQSIERKFREYVLPQRIQGNELNAAIEGVMAAVVASHHYEKVKEAIPTVIDAFGMPVHISGLRMDFVPGTPAFLARAVVRFVEAYNPDSSLEDQLKVVRKRISTSTLHYAAQFA